MKILSSHIEHARYARDFGQVEAQVAFLVKAPGRPVPHLVRLRTSEYARGAAPLRGRLIASATALLQARAASFQAVAATTTRAPVAAGKQEWQTAA